MKADLVNTLARLRDELRNVATKLDEAINAETEAANSAPPSQPTTSFVQVVLSDGEEYFLRNWFDSASKNTFTLWEKSFLDSVLQRNIAYPSIKLTQRQYDSFIKIFNKHAGTYES